MAGFALAIRYAREAHQLRAEMAQALAREKLKSKLLRKALKEARAKAVA
jgi:hypothetical protein